MQIACIDRAWLGYQLCSSNRWMGNCTVICHLCLGAEKTHTLYRLVYFALGSLWQLHTLLYLVLGHRCYTCGCLWSYTIWANVSLAYSRRTCLSQSHFLSLSTLQSEEKIKAVPSLYGPLMTLNHLVQQDYFPRSLVPVLLAFVTKWVSLFF